MIGVTFQERYPFEKNQNGWTALFSEESRPEKQARFPHQLFGEETPQLTSLPLPSVL